MKEARSVVILEFSISTMDPATWFKDALDGYQLEMRKVVLPVARERDKENLAFLTGIRVNKRTLNKCSLAIPENEDKRVLRRMVV